MAPPFIELSQQEFTDAVTGFAWPVAKSEIHVHHTWRPNHAQYRGLPTIQAMFDYHTQTNHWSDIAQHVSIGPDGSIWTGRPWGKSPASASGHNGAHVFMFETIGDFDEGRDPLTGAQLDSVLHVVATLQIRFGLDVDASVRFHNQMSSKTCPGSSVDRAAFVAMVAAKRAELEAGTPSAALSGGGPALSSAQMSQILTAVSGSGDGLNNGQTGDGDAEHDHNEALAAFMAARAANPFVGAPTAAPTAAPVAGLAAMAVETAAATDVEALFIELGRRAMAIEADPARAADMSVVTGPVDEAWAASFALRGRRLFARAERELHDLMCGESGADASDRARLRDAFGLGDDAVSAAIIAVLTGTFGLAPAIAALVAALVVRLVLRPAHSETCAVWKKRLDGDEPQPLAN